MKTLVVAALTIAGLVVAAPSFAADNPAQTAPAVTAAQTAPAATAVQTAPAVTPAHSAASAPTKSTRRRKSTNPHVLAHPFASPHNGAASAIGAD
jgi:hypothetical protein